eukprot:TRINITY_DN2647_c0_g2_i1.p1 TRINITY_DN2647_c0_g2~~TRINITY_DN2647_c0_g2_i1.p1  ORF type:complete len:225 (+),score=47.86 TRINITY_DN2647_c0_g2_i1:26-676(+)
MCIRDSMGFLAKQILRYQPLKMRVSVFILLAILYFSVAHDYPEYSMQDPQWAKEPVCYSTVCPEYGDCNTTIITMGDVSNPQPGSMLVSIAKYLTSINAVCNGDVCNPGALARWTMAKIMGSQDCFDYAGFILLGLDFRTGTSDKAKIAKLFDLGYLLTTADSHNWRWSIITSVDDNGFQVIDPLNSSKSFIKTEDSIYTYAFMWRGIPENQFLAL